MKIIVCIKQVPDTTEIKLDPVTGTLIRDGVPSIMNPDDKGGLEMALRLKDEFGAHVTVITMGPPQADDILREAFAMGVDRAIHLSDRKFAGADTLATSNALAGALRTLDYDIIMTGRQAIDGDTAQVGPQIAEHLDLPQVSYVAYGKEVEIWDASKIDVDESKLGLNGSPTRVFKSFTKGAKAAGQIYEVDPQEAVNIIVEKLKEKFII